jgi:copper transport protein
VRRLLAVALVALVALALPAAASAHATLIRTEPAYGKRVERSPSLVRLHFDQSVDVLPNAIHVYDAKGRLLSGRTRVSTDKRTIVTPVSRLPRGGYTVRWRAVSADGHVVSGVFTFGVRMRAPPATEAFGAGGPTTAEHLVRWLYFIALALLAGGLGFRLLIVRRPLGEAGQRRFYQLLGVGVIGALEVGIVAFLLRAEDALQLPFVNFLYGDLSPLAKTRFGYAFVAMTLGYALVAALVFLAWLTDRDVFLWPAFLIALGFVSGLSLSGHSAADAGSSWKSELADWAHLSAACLWIGGLVQLVVVVWPLVPELRRPALLAFSRLATVCVGVLLLAGVYLAILRLPQVSDIWTTGYGRILLVKIGLVAVAFAWGGLHKLRAVPVVARDGTLPRLRASLAGESMIGMIVLLVAAFLVNAKPPT